MGEKSNEGKKYIFLKRTWGPERGQGKARVMRASMRERATDHGSRCLRKAEGDPDAADGGSQGEVHLGGGGEEAGQ